MSTDSNDSVAAEFQRHLDMWGEEDSAAHDALEVSYAALEHMGNTGVRGHQSRCGAEGTGLGPTVVKNR